jgi:hypothetical protein
MENNLSPLIGWIRTQYAVHFLPDKAPSLRYG